MIKPLVKWAGGKRQILTHLLEHLPNSWHSYYEPFIGGGALFIALCNQGRITGATISDVNPELMNLYRVVQQQPEELYHALCHPDFENNKETYFELRNKFNRERDSLDFVEKAALFLYLNRHGYNGLWRMNSRGDFNVPFGRYKSPKFPSHELIQGFSQLLKYVTVLKGDFANAVETARKGDFVYLDPPYFPISTTSHFTAYHANKFPFEEQVRLSRLCRNLSDKGVSVMISNSRSPQIFELYHGFHIESIISARSINCRGDRRNGIPELLITNYLPGNHPTCSIIPEILRE